MSTDCHFRVGGAEGSDLQAKQCSSLHNSSDANKNCIAASLMLHVTSKASAYIENVWVWAADHDIDDAMQRPIDIYAARGILIESRGPTWLWGTSVEHFALYQYSISSAKNVVMGMIQTESPYYQPLPKAPTPFDKQLGGFTDDPTFADCKSDSTSCNISWALRIFDSSAIHVLSSGLYSWFQGHDESCSLEDKRNCQDKMVYTEQSSDVWMFNVVTIGSSEMISPLRTTPIDAASNRNGFASSILSWRGGINGTTGDREYDGYTIHDIDTVNDVKNFTQCCRNALTAPIKCHDYTKTFREPKYHGVLNNRVKEEWVCSPSCIKSMSEWIASVKQLCSGQTWRNGAPAEYSGAYIQYGLKEQCQKDPETGEYCNGKFDHPS